MVRWLHGAQPEVFTFTRADMENDPRAPDTWRERRTEEEEEEGFVPPVEAEGDERGGQQPGAIRAEDIEPYFALQYVARLFKIAAMVVVVALTAEVIAGIALEGVGAILPLFAEVIRGIVLAAILWGVGDLTVLFIDVGHDVRAARVLLGRLSARANNEPGLFQSEEPPAD
jgi:hypothetical protein